MTPIRNNKSTVCVYYNQKKLLSLLNINMWRCEQIRWLTIGGISTSYWVLVPVINLLLLPLQHFLGKRYCAHIGIDFEYIAGTMIHLYAINIILFNGKNRFLYNRTCVCCEHMVAFVLLCIMYKSELVVCIIAYPQNPFLCQLLSTDTCSLSNYMSDFLKTRYSVTEREYSRKSCNCSKLFCSTHFPSLINFWRVDKETVIQSPGVMPASDLLFH